MFTPDERDRVMLCLALNGGNACRAHRQLAKEGMKIALRTVRDYGHTARYQEIREHHAAEIERSLIGRYKQAAEKSLDLQMAATDQALTEADKGELRDPGRTAMNAAIASGTATDKALLVEGRPTVISSSTESHEVLLARMARILGHHIDSTATEIPEHVELPSAQQSGQSPEGAPAKRDTGST